MGKSLTLLVIIGIILSAIYFSGILSQKRNIKIPESLEIPAIRQNEEIVVHTAFTLSYNEEHEQANWVAYQLTREELADNFSRSKMKFQPDPQVSSGSAEDDDYRNSGFDRGHLAPAGDMNFSKDALRESFFFSNISPQQRKFNSGIWKKLEELMRDWANTYGSVYIVTGPLLETGLMTIGRNRVSVPSYFFKAVLINNGVNPPGAVAFLLENQPSKAPLRNFMIPVDSLEKLLSVDFFPGLDDSIESRIESKVSIGIW